MTFEKFQTSLNASSPPEPLSRLLQALWLDHKGNWEKAHEIAQEKEDHDSCRIHAYLHRKEGDESNARYWYRKANSPFPTVSLEIEWREIVMDFLQREQ